MDATTEALEQVKNDIQGCRLTWPEIGHIVCALLAQIPEWLATTPDTPRQLVEAIEGLERGSGRYRAYAVRNHDRQVTGFVVRPYYGGVWMPGLFEVKIGEFTA